MYIAVHTTRSASCEMHRSTELSVLVVVAIHFMALEPSPVWMPLDCFLLSITQNTASPPLSAEKRASGSITKNGREPDSAWLSCIRAKDSYDHRCGDRKAVTVYERTRVSDEGDRSLIDHIDNPTNYRTCAVSRHNKNTVTSMIRYELRFLRQK